MKKILLSAVFCGVLSAIFMSGCSSTEEKIAKLDRELDELRTQKLNCQLNKDFKCVDELNKKGEEILKEKRELRKSL
ncbi:hypothetical protein [Campylobacter upsaliensis]|uniref:Lipoprotein n=1 Tax=Campylobacter upsaliensis TaxID=28080 RepID=A0A381EH12_CAMUP|nr:hypothetical protein [Campylobacter upsaliensis]MCR2100972.1 hypothetical protein [Campylobacter upsaliensis]SUX26203.1 Uncharacterised protein [Campylobacter upsaliensis]